MIDLREHFLYILEIKRGTATAAQLILITTFPVATLTLATGYKKRVAPTAASNLRI